MKHNALPLSGAFVNLRLLSVDDALITFQWRQSQRAFLLNKGAQSVDEQARWIQNRPASEYNFIIETKAREPVGMLSLVDVDPVNKRAESARFLIGDEEKVKGIPAAVESMKMLYEFAFNALGFQRIYGTIASDNALMIKWQKYLGMKEEGRLRNHYFINGTFQDAVFLGILADEYRTVALSKMNSLIAMATKK